MLYEIPKAVFDNDPEFQRLKRRLHKARTETVVHHETCPRCGAKLVNLYRKSTKDKLWMCRKCWDKHEADVTPNA